MRLVLSGCVAALASSCGPEGSATDSTSPARLSASAGTPSSSLPASPSPGRPGPVPSAPVPSPPDPSPSDPDPTAPGSPAASPSARTAPDRSLATNSLYRIDLGGRQVRCTVKVRDPRPPLRNADLAPYLRTVVGCLTKAFRAPLADVGFDLETPQVRTYSKTVKTPCGSFGRKRAPAYYCPAGATVYWPVTSDDGSEAYTYARLGYVALAAHEYGHHLQATTGLISRYAEQQAAATSASERHLAQPSARVAGAMLRGGVPVVDGTITRAERG